MLRGAEPQTRASSLTLLQGTKFGCIGQPNLYEGRSISSEGSPPKYDRQGVQQHLTAAITTAQTDFAKSSFEASSECLFTRQRGSLLPAAYSARRAVYT